MQNERFNPIEDVKVFHELFDHPVLENPTIPALSRCNLRVDLLQEELDELREAIADGNMVEVADALADLQYVLAGAVHEFGLGKLFPRIFAEVQRSNMSKACVDVNDANATIAKYKEEKNVECNYFHKYLADGTGVFIVHRISDLKTVKSVNYSPADLSFVNQEDGTV